MCLTYQQGQRSEILDLIWFEKVQLIVTKHNTTFIKVLLEAIVVNHAAEHGSSVLSIDLLCTVIFFYSILNAGLFE